MSSIVNRLLNNIKPRHDDDFVDRANYFYSALLFGLCATTVGMKQYVGQPIQCWIPPDFERGWEKYAESYCFVENTYFANMHEQFPEQGQEREKNELGYYQWVPFLLVAQMVVCILPKILLSAINFNLDFTIEKLVDMASVFDKDKKSYKVSDPSKYRKAGEYMKRAFKLRKNKINHGRSNKLSSLRTCFYRSAMTKFYLLYKLINLGVALAQIYLLNTYFWPEHNFSGIDFIRDLYNDRRWKESGWFPRVTFCDVTIREIAEKPVTHTLQCVLMINMFAEKLYIVIWFWLLGLSALNAFNLIHWLWCTHLNFNNTNFIDHYLDLNDIDREDFEPHLAEFVNEHLAMDGVTALRLLEINCGDVETSVMVKSLWEEFKQGVDKLESDQSEDDENGPNLYEQNQMTQSTCTTSTSVTADSSPLSANYSNFPTLPLARQRVGGNFAQSNV